MIVFIDVLVANVRKKQDNHKLTTNMESTSKNVQIILIFPTQNGA